MTDQRFIGRGENLVKSILERPLLSTQIIMPQVPIQRLVSKQYYDFYNDEVKKHKFDLVIYRRSGQKIAFEVNYHHGNKAAQKANDIFIPDLKENGIDYVKLDDWDSRSIFKETKNGYHKKNWNDYRDVIDALDNGGIKP